MGGRVLITSTPKEGNPFAPLLQRMRDMESEHVDAIPRAAAPPATYHELLAYQALLKRRGLAGLGFGLAASHGAPAASWSSSP